MDTVEEQIDALKTLYRASSDKELAQALGIGSTAISAWRNRGSVPTRYVGAVMKNERLGIPSPDFKTDEEVAAFSLAMMRCMRNLSAVTQNERAFLEFGWNLPFFFYREYPQALEDVEKKVKDATESFQLSSVQSVFSVIVHDEFFDCEKSGD
ncbi:MAG: helix-turn-helix domain-containing protein [Rhodobacteraceae bacterium]|nr:helix-turn-helix domain-containing protein [Paracoccaceae bacterium]